jgi:hypothetical protein
MLRKFIFPTIILAWGIVLLAQTPFGPYGVLPVTTGNTATDTIVLTVGQINSQLLTGTPTAAAVYTTPSATDWCNAFPFIASSSSQNWNYDLYVKNTAATNSNAITFTGGTGVTFVSSPSISGGHMRVLRVIFQNCTVPTIAIVPYGSNAF